MSKRSHAAAITDGPRLRIKLASTGEPDADAPVLDPQAYLVRMYSAVAMQLPATDEWDLSGLLVEGQPVSRATVVAWLNAACHNTYGTDYEQQEDSPACTFNDLYRLLLFADAVDSTRPLLKACCARLQQLQLRALLGQQQVSLKTDGTSYAFSTDGHLCTALNATGNAAVPGLDPAASEEQQAFRQQVAAQTEQLLWLAYRLQLQSLVQGLHTFIGPLCWFANSLLADVSDSVFTTRVLEAAGVADLPGGKQNLINSMCGEFVGLTQLVSPGVGTHLRPVGLTQQQLIPLKFNAVVQRSSLALPQGAVVQVELDLFGSSALTLNGLRLPVQLRIGYLAGPDIENT